MCENALGSHVNANEMFENALGVVTVLLSDIVVPTMLV